MVRQTKRKSVAEPEAAADEDDAIPQTESVSKGCFLFPAQERVPADDPEMKGFFRLLPKESSKHIALRESLFETTWGKMEQSITRIQSSQHDSVFKELVDFMHRVREADQTFMGLDSSEIPAALLLTGVNLPDHDDVFGLLQQHLKTNLSPYVATLRARECSGLKGIINGLLDQFLAQTHTIPAVRPSGDIQMLLGWYAMATAPPAPPTPKKEKRKSDAKADTPKAGAPVSAAGPSRPPLVIVFQDFESFDSTAIDHFIALCSARKAALPVYLIFGIASTADVLHQRLTRRAMTCISTACFRIRSAPLMLVDALMELQFSNQHAIKLGGRPLKHMIDHFRLETCSLNSFARNLKYVVLEHCSENPVSFLCDYSKLEEHLESLTEEHCEYVRALPSFRAHVESLLDPAEQRSLLLEIPALCERAQDCLHALRAHDAVFHGALLGLHAAVNALPTNTGVTTLPSYLPSLYSVAMRKRVCESDGAVSLFRVMRLSFAPDLLAIFRATAEAMERWVADNHAPAIYDGAKQCRKHMTSLQEVIDAPPEVVTPAPVPKELEYCNAGPKTAVVTDTSSWKRRKLLLRGEAPRRDTRFDTVRKEAVSFLESFFTQHLHPPSEFPLHELVYHPDAIRDVVEGKPRAVIQAGLATPARYLGAGAEPDICVAYRLFQECGTLINLYDWLQAFASVISGEEHVDGPPDPSVQARFAQAVTELQMLGFVKSTKRKTDHMQRQAWCL